MRRMAGLTGQDLFAERGPLQGMADALGEVVLRPPAQQALRAVDPAAGAGGVTGPSARLAHARPGGRPPG